MDVTEGVNSYGTLDEFKEYLKGRYGSEVVNTVPSRAALLITAARELDLLICGSKPATATQAMLFPVAGGCGCIPRAVKVAQFEIAINLATIGGVPGSIASESSGQEVTEIKAGSVGLKFGSSSTKSVSRAKGNPLLTDNVKALLSPYGLCDTGGGTTIVKVYRG